MRIAEIAANGHAGRNIPITVFQHDCPGEAAVVFPGMRYTAGMPLLYYASRALFGNGLDVLSVGINYSRDPYFGDLSREDRAVLLSEDTDAVMRAAHERYARVRVILGKSLGTRAVAHALRDNGTVERAIWLTPIVSDEELLGKMMRVTCQSLLVIGTNDPFYDGDALERLGRTANFEILRVTGADHSLETEDTDESLRILTTVVSRIRRFIA